MRYFAGAFLLIFSIFSGKSQTYELGGVIGGSNYVGDVGSTNYIAPTDLAVGGIFRWNRSPRHSFRLGAMLAGIRGDDANSNERRRQERGYSFTNVVRELSLGMEYTFWEFDLHSGKDQSTPYLYTGLVFFGYNGLALDENQNLSEYNNSWNFAIPMAIGYKMTLSTKLILGFEAGARYTFTDNLDGSNPTGEKEEFYGLKFGNLNSNDWYFYTGITLTFAFGREPCYCNF